MTQQEADKLVQQLREIPCFREMKIVQRTPKQAKYSFNLIGTQFFLDLVPNHLSYINYKPTSDFHLCWEKKQFVWQSYTLFEVIEEVPEELGNELLFHINIFQDEGEPRYKFPGS